MAIAGCAIGPCGGFCGATGGTSLRFVASESENGGWAAGAAWNQLAGCGIRPCHDLAVLNFGGPAERVLARSEAVLALLAELPRPGRRSQPLSVGFRVHCATGLQADCPLALPHLGRLESCPVPTAEERKRFL